MLVFAQFTESRPSALLCNYSVASLLRCNFPTETLISAMMEQVYQALNDAAEISAGDGNHPGRDDGRRGEPVV